METTSATPPRTRRAVTTAAWAVLATLAVAATACSGDDSGSTSADRAAPAIGEQSFDAEVRAGVSESLAAPATSIAASAALSAESTAGATDQGPAANGSVPPALQPLDIGRSIIFTATVSVQVDSVAVASDGAMQAIAGLGGFLYGQQSSNDPVPTNVLTFKVAPKDFQEALRRLGGLGTIVDQQVSSDDVTGQVVDLRSRIIAAEVSVERLRTFLQEAGDVNTLASLERELLQRETDLETLRGQLRTIEAQVDLATITMTITQDAPVGPAIDISVTAYAGDDGGADAVAACPGDDQLEVREGERITVCYELHNVGSTPLGQLRLDDPGMGLSRDDLRVVQGDLSVALAPDQSVVLVASVDADTEALIAPRLRVVALDEEGEPLRTQVTTSVDALDLQVAPDDAPPSFGRSLSTGWDGLTYVVRLLVALFGLLLPFIWIVPLAVVALRWYRPRRQARREAAAQARARAVVAASVPGAVFGPGPGATAGAPQPPMAAPAPQQTPAPVPAAAPAATPSGPATPTG